MLKTPECPLSQRFNLTASSAETGLKSPAQQNKTSVEEGFWFPVLFAFHDVLMTGRGPAKSGRTRSTIFRDSSEVRR